MTSSLLSGDSTVLAEDLLGWRVTKDIRKGAIVLVLPVFPWPSGGVASPAGSGPEDCVWRTRFDAIAKGVCLMAKVRAHHLATEALLSPRLGDIVQCTVSFGDFTVTTYFCTRVGEREGASTVASVRRSEISCLNLALRSTATVIENTSHQPMALHRLTDGSTAVLLDTAVRRRKL